MKRGGRKLWGSINATERKSNTKRKKIYKSKVAKRMTKAERLKVMELQWETGGGNKYE